MIVKDLIVQLLDCNAEAEFDIDLVTAEESENTSEFELDEAHGYVTLRVESTDNVLINKRSYDELINELGALRDKVEELS